MPGASAGDELETCSRAASHVLEPPTASIASTEAFGKPEAMKSVGPATTGDDWSAPPVETVPSGAPSASRRQYSVPLVHGTYTRPRSSAGVAMTWPSAVAVQSTVRSLSRYARI